MLAATLANHHRTTPPVLAVLADVGDSYSATVARYRTGHPDPWGALGLDYLGEGELIDLLNLKGMTAAQRRSLLSAIRPDIWVWDEVSSHLTDADKEYLATIVLRAPDESPNAVRALLPDPNIPASIALQLLESLDGSDTPAFVVAVADNHHLDPALLPFDRLPYKYTREGAVRDALDAYQNADRNLADLLANAPWQTVAGPSQCPFPLSAIASYTSNEAVADQIADRFINGSHGLERSDAERVYQQLLSNRNLPGRVRTRLVRHVYENTARLSLNTLLTATATLAQGDDPDDEATIDLAITTAPEDVAYTILAHPRLTASHLRALTYQLYTNDPPCDDTLIAAHIAAHPATDPETRALARRQITPDKSGQEGICALALNIPLRTTDLPRHPDTYSQTLCRPALNTFINRHPDLLTDPNLVRAVLTLAPTYDGLLDELVSTAAEIIRPASHHLNSSQPGTRRTKAGCW